MVLGLLAVFVLALKIIWVVAPGPERAAQAQPPTDPPDIQPNEVELYAPGTGSSAQIYVSPQAITGGVTDTQVSARNVSIDPDGPWSQPALFDPNRGTYLRLSGAGGDLIELHAENVAGEDFALIGYLPDPGDDARPAFDDAKLTATFTAPN
ncbi:MAG: hypothetical protein ACE5GW_04645, partial [Planctomycetota bacterium]